MLLFFIYLKVDKSVWSFFVFNIGLVVNYAIRCDLRPNYLAGGYQGLHAKQAKTNKNKLTGGIHQLLIHPVLYFNLN